MVSISRITNFAKILRAPLKEGSSFGANITKKAEEGLKFATTPIGDTLTITKEAKDSAKISKDLLQIAPNSKKNITNAERSLNKREQKVANEIHYEYYPLYEKISPVIYDIFQPLVDEGIMKVHCRIKSPESLLEKMESLGCRTKDEAIEKITDIIGFRITLLKSSDKDIQKIMKVFNDEIPSGRMILRNIKIKRPKAVERLSNPEIYDCIPYKFIEDFSANVTSATGKTIETKINLSDVNYTGTHISFLMPTRIKNPKNPANTIKYNPVVECQVIRHNEERSKMFQDPFYKSFAEKNLPKKFRFLQPRIEELKQNENLKNIHQKYEAEVMLDQVKKDMNMTSKSRIGEFLSWKQFIPELHKQERIQLYNELNMMPEIIRDMSPEEIRTIFKNVPKESVNKIIAKINKENQVAADLKNTLKSKAERYIETNNNELNESLGELLKEILNKSENGINYEELYDLAFANNIVKRKKIISKAAEKMQKYDYNFISEELG